MVFTVDQDRRRASLRSSIQFDAASRTFLPRPHPAVRTQRSRAQPNAALLIIEDVTEHERAQRLEIEASNLRLVKSMAEHLAHEIGNSLVPLSTHQQLLKESINDPEFQESLSEALAVGVKRISRLSNQMVFLAREWTGRVPRLGADLRPDRRSLPRGAHLSIPAKSSRSFRSTKTSRRGKSAAITRRCATPFPRSSSMRSRPIPKIPTSRSISRRAKAGNPS